MNLRELQIGQSIEGLHCYISALEERLTGKGEAYVTATFKDQKGDTKVNLWKTSLKTFEFKVKDVVVLDGNVGEYNGKPQLNIIKMDRSEKKLNDFGRTSNFSIDSMMVLLLNKHINTIQDPFVKYLCDSMIMAEPFRGMFMAAPAAKGMHHPWKGGLLEHVLGLCNLADSTYKDHYINYFPHMRMDLVKFGLMFHDWGKIAEYEYSTPDIKYTMHGALMHHMGIVCDMLTRKQVEWETANPNDRPRSRKLLQELLHIVYSHHGKIEWSSIMTPATPEALFVHLLDYTDAKMMHMQDLINDGIEGDIPGMSKFSYAEKAAYKLPDIK